MTRLSRASGAQGPSETAGRKNGRMRKQKQAQSASRGGGGRKSRRDAVVTLCRCWRRRAPRPCGPCAAAAAALSPFGQFKSLLAMPWRPPLLCSSPPPTRPTSTENDSSQPRNKDCRLDIIGPSGGNQHLSAANGTIANLGERIQTSKRDRCSSGILLEGHRWL